MGRGEVDHTPDWRLAAALAVVVAACSVGPALWAWSVADRLPAEVARHWGGSGVTGTWPLTTQLAVLGSVTVLVACSMGAAAVVGRMPLSVRRMLAGGASWMAVVFAALQVDGLRGQLDLADPTTAPAPTLGVGVGAALGLLAALGVGAAARETATAAPANRPPSADLPRLGPHAVPLERARGPSSRALTGTAIGTVVLSLALVGLLGWAVALFAGVIVLVIIAHVRFTVTIGDEGVRVGNRLLTMLHVPLEQIAGADTATVDPFWEFGGWGLRVDVHGRTGVVTRKGPALVLHRGDGSEVVVSLDEADQAAATVNTLAERRFPTR